MEIYKITFFPDNKTVSVKKDTTILSAAISAGVYINSACGGDGVCGHCKVIIKKGKVFSQSTGILSPEEKAQGIHLACQSAIQGDCEVEIPAGSRVNFEKDDFERSGLKDQGVYSQVEEIEPSLSVGSGGFKDYPLSRKIYLELPKPDLEDKISDLERIYRQIKRSADIELLETPLANIRTLGELLRSADWKITVTLAARYNAEEIILIEPGDTSTSNFGICFDIGTTTLSGQLVDLNTKRILGTKAAYNKQANFGSDVITRIVYARDPDGLTKLHAAVCEGMNEIIHELTIQHQVDLNDVTCIICAGNTTMIHLLLRIDPTFIRKEPYIATANFLPVSRASDAGIKINPRGLLYCIAGVASYVGADVTSGVLSSGLYKQKDLCLLIDIGTNGEIVLGNQDFMVASAASAGPAFEGSGVACGMRASAGAIEEVKISPGTKELNYKTIANEKPRGICGSGYIDLIAEMLSAGILDKDGKIKAIEHPRIRKTDLGRAFIVVFKAESRTDEDIVITEIDIDNLKRAKAAIYAAASILVRHMGLKFENVSRVIIAGGFGTSIDMESAVKIGLLPDLSRERFNFVGNSSLAGASQALLSLDALRKCDEIARKITYFELSTEGAYMEEYMAALFFPHTDLTKFPSLKK